MSELEEDEDDTSTQIPEALELVVEKISTEHGFDVRGYKRTTLYRRIRKRMADARCETLEDYLVRLETDAHEYAQLINTILINVTEFFRDPAAWDYIQSACLEPLVQRKRNGEPIRAWSVGCATGEEAYSLAICLTELTNGASRPVKVYATDMDEGALAVARAGVYGPDDLRHVSPERRERYFEELPGGRFRVRREVRSLVIFGHHNVLEHAPISRLDILVCRNLLIYFDSDTQQQLLKRFNYALREEGFLFLGKAETLMSRSPLFRAAEARHRVFQKMSHEEHRTRLVPSMPRSSNREVDPGAGQMPREYQVPVTAAPNPLILLDSEGILLAASSTAREIFGISERSFGSGLVQLDERVRPTSLRVAVEDARTTGRESRLNELTLSRADGSRVVLNLDIKPILDAQGYVYRLAIWGHDVTREQELVSELTQVRQELETTSEELQTTNEELETTNEELETTNEELQSTNEELETTIEELQSTNEELETANEELRARQEELNDRDRFQTMILSSLQMGVIVVTNNWDVVSWNKTCESLWGVREDEVVGHSLFSLDTGMPFGDLRRSLVAVCQGEVPSQTTEVEAVNRRGKPIRCRVQVLPLVEPANGTAGAMILIDSSAERPAP